MISRSIPSFLLIFALIALATADSRHWYYQNEIDNAENQISYGADGRKEYSVTDLLNLYGRLKYEDPYAKDHLNHHQMSYGHNELEKGGFSQADQISGNSILKKIGSYSADEPNNPPVGKTLVKCYADGSYDWL
ncbi:unnamed protein product [Diabrotica balteata]|uniref:Uncharacterized protein n=1 Tax=Diabrotica balteata TaxID=107213 RepID=A0A9P0E1U0_DIABA|nr:unnamed protein product [Diabrotica balteata]